MDLQTWVSIASLLAVGLAIVGIFTRQIDSLGTDLKGEIGTLSARLDDTRAELKGDISSLRAEMKSEFGRVESRLGGLEQRTFELSTRLPPLPTRAE